MGSAIATIELSSTDKLLSTIVDAARDPQVDAAKMRELWMLKKDIDEQQAKSSFQRAMISAQEEMRPIVKDIEVCNNANEVTNRYAKLEKIDKAIRPIYLRFGFVLTFGSELAVSGFVLTCTCMHRDGHAEKYSLPGPLDSTNKVKNALQALGSTISYYRRYLTCMIFNIVLVDHDDDGNGASATITQEQLNKILDLIHDKPPAWESSLCKFMSVQRLEDIKERDFYRAYQAIKSKVGTKNA